MYISSVQNKHFKGLCEPTGNEKMKHNMRLIPTTGNNSGHAFS